MHGVSKLPKYLWHLCCIKKKMITLIFTLLFLPITT